MALGNPFSFFFFCIFTFTSTKSIALMPFNGSLMLDVIPSKTSSVSYVYLQVYPVHEYFMWCSGNKKSSSLYQIPIYFQELVHIL